MSRLDGNNPAILLRKMPWSETSLIVTCADRTLRNSANRCTGCSPAEKRVREACLTSSTQLTLRSRSVEKETCIPCERSASGCVFNVSDAGNAGFYLASYFGELAAMAAPSMQPLPRFSISCDAASILCSNHQPA